MKHCQRCNSNRIETKVIETPVYFKEMKNCLDCGYRDYSYSTKELDIPKWIEKNIIFKQKNMAN